MNHWFTEKICWIQKRIIQQTTPTISAIETYGKNSKSSRLCGSRLIKFSNWFLNRTDLILESDSQIWFIAKCIGILRNSISIEFIGSKKLVRFAVSLVGVLFLLVVIKESILTLKWITSPLSSSTSTKHCCSSVNCRSDCPRRLLKGITEVNEIYFSLQCQKRHNGTLYSCFYITSAPSSTSSGSF